MRSCSPIVISVIIIIQIYIYHSCVNNIINRSNRIYICSVLTNIKVEFVKFRKEKVLNYER